MSQTQTIIQTLKGYPWHIAILGFIILVVTNGMTANGNTVFDRAFLETFNWSRSELRLAGTITFLGSAALIFFIGMLIDRIGVKACLLFGTLLLSVCLFSYSLVENLIHLYLIHIAFALVIATAGTNVVVILVSQYFRDKRGIAIGIALMGTSAGGMIISRLGTELLENMTWREAFRTEAILPLFLTALILFLVTNKKVMDVAPQKEAFDEKEEQSGWSFQETMRSRTYWMLVGSAFLTYFTIMALVQNLFLHGTDQGLTASEATNLFIFLTFGAMATKFAVGFFTDYFHPFLIFRILLVIMILGVIMITMVTADLLWFAILIMSLGWGGMYTLYNFMVVDLYGLKAAGKNTGVIAIFESVGAATGPFVLARIYDGTGSYQFGFWLLVGFLMLSLLISTQFRDPRRRHMRDPAVLGTS